MADEKLTRWLIENGVEAWNTEREKTRDLPPGIHTMNSDFVLPDFSDTNFWWAFQKYGASSEEWPISLAEINFIQANLSHAMLRLVDFTGARLSGSRLRNANLRKTKLIDAHLQRADLRNALLHEADLTRADLSGALLKGAEFCNATLVDTNLVDAELIGADLSGASPWKATLFTPHVASPDQYMDRLEAVTSVSDLLIEVGKLRDHHDSRSDDISFYFRGEPRCGWDLKPSVMRGEFTGVEGDMLLELISRRPEEFSELPSSLAQWVLAQHHGLKTRFLDVTKNPMVALFHACEENPNYDTEDARLHVFAVPRALIKSFNSDAASVLASFAKLPRREQDLLLGRDTGPRENSDVDFGRYRKALDRVCQLIQEEKPYFQNDIDVKDLFRVFVLEPQQFSERLKVQSGAFLVSGFHERFEREEVQREISNIHTYAHYVLSIPYGRKRNIIEDLQLINIRRETLFPGLDEAAKAITDAYCL